MTKKPDAQSEHNVETTLTDVADELVSQAREAAAIFTQYSQQEVDHIVDAAARAGAARHIELARKAVDETGMGVFEDKVIKNLFATEYVYNDIRDTKTVGLVNDCPETGIMEFAEPMGVVLGIAPVTNPTSSAYSTSSRRSSRSVASPPVKQMWGIPNSQHLSMTCFQSSMDISGWSLARAT